MTTNSKVKVDQQSLDAGSPVISLFELDATNQGASQPFYFTTGTDAGNSVEFNSVSYFPLPVRFEGLSQSAEGVTPRPTLTISNITKIILAEVITYNDLIGAKLTRTKTFVKYLDGHSEADPTAKFVDEVFFVETKLKQNKFHI